MPSKHDAAPYKQMAQKVRQSKGNAGQDGSHDARHLGGEGQHGDGSQSASTVEGSSKAFFMEPLLAQLPDSSRTTAWRQYLPSYVLPSKSAAHRSSSVSTPKCADWASFDRVDLGDGKGLTPVLLQITTSGTLRVFRLLPSTPAPLDMPERFRAPEEIFQLQPPGHSDDGRPSALPIAAACFTRRSSGQAAPAQIAIVRDVDSHRELVTADMKSGEITRRVALEGGGSASVTAGERWIVVATGSPLPHFHVLDAVTLSPMVLALTLPIDQTPVFACAGRMLAYATLESPAYVGATGRGSVAYAHSADAHTAGKDSTISDVQGHRLSQGPVLTSAMAIGGLAARGVWTGLRAGARMANQARSAHLSSSAPSQLSSSTEVRTDEMEGTSRNAAVSNTSSMAGADAESNNQTRWQPGSYKAVWIKIVDLSPRSGQPLRTIAHFRLPPSSAGIPKLSHGPSFSTLPSDTPRGTPVSFLLFSPDGTKLFAAPHHGRSFHILNIRPMGNVRRDSNSVGSVWHEYELRRGRTSATVQHVNWSTDGRFVTVTTGGGTVHVYGIHPDGGPTCASSHTTVATPNIGVSPSLSVLSTPIAQLRPLDRREVVEEPERNIFKNSPTVAILGQRRALSAGAGIEQDVFVYRYSGAINVSRLKLQSSGGHVDNGSQELTAKQTRSSALSEMMRRQLSGTASSDLHVRTSMPLQLSLLPPSTDTFLAPEAGSNAQSKVKPTKRPPILAHAEINTHLIRSRSLPASIYQSRQVSFFAARPTDDYSPLSVLELEARERAITFRPEVIAKTGIMEDASFDEPLLSALHTVNEEVPKPLIPGLPNGSPRSSRWSHFPIRQVASGLGEGVERMRREYAKAQQIRGMQRSQVTHGNHLSFDEGAVFPASLTDGGESSPSSGALPDEHFVANSTDDSEWGDQWEEEYRRAVEDDGGPEELITGVMDEEAEDRRRWEQRRKVMIKEYDRKGFRD